MQIAAEIGHHKKQEPHRDESEQQQRNRPALLDTIHPSQKRPSPLRRRNFGARGHRRERKVHGYTTHNAQVTQTKSLIPSHGARRRRSVRQSQATSLELFKTLHGRTKNFYGITCADARTK